MSRLLCLACCLIAAVSAELRAQGADTLLTRNAKVRVWISSSGWVAKEGMIARRRGDTLNINHMVRMPGTGVVSTERMQVLLAELDSLEVWVKSPLAPRETTVPTAGSPARTGASTGALFGALVGLANLQHADDVASKGIVLLAATALGAGVGAIIGGAGGAVSNAVGVAEEWVAIPLPRAAPSPAPNATAPPAPPPDPQ